MIYKRINFRLEVLTRSQEVSDLVISLSEWVEDPPAAGKISFVGVVVVVGEGAEAVDPQANTLHLGPVEPGKED